MREWSTRPEICTPRTASPQKVGHLVPKMFWAMYIWLFVYLFYLCIYLFIFVIYLFIFSASDHVHLVINLFISFMYLYVYLLKLHIYLKKINDIKTTTRTMHS